MGTAEKTETPRLTVRAFLRRLVIYSAMFVFLLPLSVVVANSYRMRMTTTATPAVLALRFDDIEIKTADGLTLRGWWIPAEGRSDRTLVVCHGVGANRDDLIRFYSFLHGGGYNILTWDWRGHGLSDWSRVTFGLVEKRDMRSALDWLAAHHPDQARWIGAFAISMGAGIVLQSVPLCPEVKAFVLDSPFASVRSMLPFQFRFLPSFLHTPLAALTAFYARFVIGESIDAVAPIECIGAIAPRPVFIIHGTADQVIPYQQSEDLGRRAGEPKTVWIEQGVPHVSVHEYHTSSYERRVLQFYEKASTRR